MIPPDLASSLRVIVPDSKVAEQARNTQPVAATQRITDVLSNLVPGQRILAEIQALLPNGSYRATVAQRDVTLALPFSAKPGDSLELEVTESDGKLTLAFVANRGEAAAKAADVSVSTSLSRTGQLIGDLMQGIEGEGKRAPAAPLNGNQAIVPTMPKDAADLAPVLKQALAQSGMFYEAHQAKWVAGQLPTAKLLEEPQGKFSPPPQPYTVNTAQGEEFSGPSRQTATSPFGQTAQQDVRAGQETTYSANIANAQRSAPQNALTATQFAELDTPPGAQQAQAAPPSTTGLSTDTSEPATQASTPQQTSTQERTANGAPSTVNIATGDKTAEATKPETFQAAPSLPRTESSTPSPNTGIPREIAPLVQQQLDGLANQNFAWQGQIWPGQPMWWEIGENPQDGKQVGDEMPARWQTRLKLQLPQLGDIDATLRLQPGGDLAIRVVTDSAESEAQLQAGLDALCKQMEAAGLNIRQALISHEQPKV